MTIVCPHCQKPIDYSGERPRFCGFCGQTLSSDSAQAVQATAAYPLSDAALHAETLAPHQPAPAGTFPAVPERIGGYRLLRTLGGGGMGTVYEAEELASSRRVALKLILPHFAASRGAVERFRQEGRLASSIAHPRCVFVVAADEDAGRPYIVMELMPGQTLEDLVRRDGPLQPQGAVRQILDVVEGLREAHRLGVVHRDVKPNNCFLDDEGRVKIGDFGLSKSLVSDQQLTKTGSFLGTPLYASPEQIRGEHVDHQSDVYSVAATLYYLLTGKAPFQSGDAMATLARIAADEAPSMRTVRPEIPLDLDRIVLRGLERDRRKRWQNLEEFERALRAFLPGQLSIGGLGIRLAAYFVDIILASIIWVPISFYITSLYGVNEFSDAYAQVTLFPARVSLGLIYWSLYLGLPEGLWGASLGKYILGLQLRRTTSSDPPGVLRAVLRAFLVAATGELYGTGMVIAIALWVEPGTSWQVLMNQSVLIWFAATGSGVANMLISALLLCTPMRMRNGYRGTHDFLFGTIVVSRPAEGPQRTAFKGKSLEERLTWPVTEAPAQVGPFKVDGVLRWDASERWLLATEPSLSRKVLIWLRPADEPALPAARRELSRVIRPRWLAAGVAGDWRWDAFLAVMGSTVPELMQDGTRFNWFDVRGVLEQLAGELPAACRDGTLPANFSLEHVWLQTDGRIWLLDSPLTPSQRQAPAVPERVQETDGPPTLTVADSRRFDDPGRAREAKGLWLLGETAVGLLEGRRLSTEETPEPLRVPLPLHARSLIHRILGIEEPRVKLDTVNEWLAAARFLPPEVTRRRRAAHQALLLAFIVSQVGIMFFLAYMIGHFLPPMEFSMRTRLRESSLVQLEKGLPADVTLILSQDPWISFHGAHLLDRDLWILKLLRDRAERDRELRRQLEPVQGLSLTFANFVIEMGGDQQGLQRMLRPNPDFRTEAMQNTFFVLFSGPPPILFWIHLVACGLWPLIWTIWSFAFRGGLMFRWTGLALVRSDGRPAARWQCAWRTLLSWLPILALLMLSHELTIRFWMQVDTTPFPQELGIAALLSWWSAVALTLAYPLLVLLQPTRGLHDRLAGTRVVTL